MILRSCSKNVWCRRENMHLLKIYKLNTFNKCYINNSISLIYCAKPSKPISFHLTAPSNRCFWPVILLQNKNHIHPNNPYQPHILYSCKFAVDSLWVYFFIKIVEPNRNPTASSPAPFARRSRTRGSREAKFAKHKRLFKSIFKQIQAQRKKKSAK